MIIVIGGIKGGTGKSTIAMNLAVMRSLLTKRKKILLVDADEQKSISDWVEHRENLGIVTPWKTIHLTGAGVRSQLNKLAINYDDIIIDTGGRDTTSQRSALTIADVFIIPFLPRSLDIWTLNIVESLISEIIAVNPSLSIFSLINRADFQGKDNDDTAAILKESENIDHLPICIRQRKAFANATAEGLAVAELKNIDRKAADEIGKLYQYLFGIELTPK
jgi:chromosome partitioning protein